MMADHDSSIRTAVVAIAATVFGGATTGYFGYLSGSIQADSQRAAKCAESVSDHEKTLRDRAEKLLVAYATLSAKVQQSQSPSATELQDWRALATQFGIAAYTLAAQSDDQLAKASFTLADDVQVFVFNNAAAASAALARKSPDDTRVKLRTDTDAWLDAYSSQIKKFTDSRSQCRAGA